MSLVKLWILLDLTDDKSTLVQVILLDLTDDKSTLVQVILLDLTDDKSTLVQVILLDLIDDKSTLVQVIKPHMPSVLCQWFWQYGLIYWVNIVTT